MQSRARFVRQERHRRVVIVSAGAVAVWGLLSARAALGGGPAGIGSFGDVCNLSVPGMTDLDQVRSSAPGIPGLPGNGTQYCVPTCQIDLIKYLANNGYAEIDPPGPGPWTSPAVYNDHTNYLALMGWVMQTSATTGTTGTNANNGIQEWLNTFDPNGDITFTSKFRTSTDAPELGDFALALLCGQLVSGSVGWYSQAPGNIWNRNGGHCFPVTGLPGFCTSNRSITIRDPGGGGDTTTQSAPQTDLYPIFTRNAIFNSTNTQGVVTSFNGPLEQMVGYVSGGSNFGHLDGFRAYAAKYGIFYDGFGINMVMPNPGFSIPPRSTHTAIPGGLAAVIGQSLHPNLIHVDVLISEGPSVFSVQRVNPLRAEISRRPLPTGLVPTSIVHG